MTSTDTLSTAAQIYKMLTYETASNNEAMVVLAVVQQLLIGDSIDADKDRHASTGYGPGV